MALLEGVCYWEWVLRFQKLKPEPAALSFLLRVDSDVELLATFPAPCLATCFHAPYHDGSGLNL